jgi:hypothetical protein
MGDQTNTTICWYDLPTDSKRAERVYQTMTRLMSSAGYPPEMLSVHGAGFSGKPSGFKRNNAKLERNGFAAVTDFTLFAPLPDAQVPVNDYNVMACYSIAGSFALIAARSTVLPLGDSRTRGIATELVEHISPRYGIGYERAQRLGPATYAIGISQGLGESGEEYAEALRISRWGDRAIKERVWRDGILRDVFPWNFINRQQLTMPVGEVPLGVWIGEDAKRGVLEQVSDDLHLWRLAPEQFGSVRAVLVEAKLIFGL